MRKLLLLLALVVSAGSYGQVATKTQWGVVRSTDSLNETRDGFLLGPGAGRYLKALIDSNTANLARKQPLITTSSNVVSGTLTAAKIFLQGANAAETAKNSMLPLPGGGVEFGGNPRLSAGGIGAGGNLDVKPDGNLYLFSNTNGNRSLFLHSDGISVNRGTNTARRPVDIGSNVLVDGDLQANSLTLGGQKITSWPSGGGNFVLASASPYVPVSTSANSSTIADNLSIVFGMPVFGRTQADVQAAINALPASGTLVPRLTLFGTYDFSANANSPLQVNRNVELIGLNNATFDGGTVNGFLVLFNNISTRLLVENLRFRSNSTTSSYALTYFNEQGDCNNVTFRNCRWTAPKGNYNGFGANAHNGTSGAIYRNWLLENCSVDSVGRMGYEFLSQKNDGIIRIQGLTMNNCKATSVGLYNPVNAVPKSVNGMGASISGDIEDVTMNNFRCTDCLLGIEVVSVKKISINNPYITGARSTTYNNGIIIGSTGISLTDGGSADNGVTGRAARDVNVTGGYINVAGKALGTYVVDGATISSLRAVGGAYLELMYGNRLTLDNVNYETTGNKFIMALQNQKQFVVRNSSFSRAKAVNGPFYEPLSVDGNCADGNFSNVHIWTNTGYNGGNPDNYFNDAQPFRLRYINEAGTNITYSNVFLNGQRMPDFNNTIIPTRIITDAGSQSLLKHIERVSFNPAVNSPIGSYTLTMPQGWYDGQPLDIYFGGAITAGTVVSSLSLVAADGNAVMQSLPLTNVLAGSVVQYRYVQAVGRWFEARLAPKGNYAEVASYDAMTRQLPVRAVTTFNVLSDEKYNSSQPSEYRVWPSGAIMWQASQKVN